MKVGKIPASSLRKYVLNRLESRNRRVLVRAGIGEDAAAIDFGPTVCLVSSDPITGAGSGIARLAVNVACNDIAAMGGEPIGLQVVLLMPESSEMEQIGALMSEVDKAAGELGVEIIGGHTEVVSKVSEPLIVMTALGATPRHSLVSSAGARPGDDILLTKGAGLEGTAILADLYAARLKQSLPEAVLDEARGLVASLSVLPEARIAVEHGVHAMHDVTEGGLYGAVWELAQAAQIGVEIWPEEVPVLPETRAICDVLGIDPLGLLSSGSMLIVAPAGTALQDKLESAGIKAAVIGRVRDDDQRLVVFSDSESRKLPPPKTDELWRLLENLEQ